jgi:Tfp pilus assembly protein PilO
MASSFSQLGASFARLSSMERRFIILVLVIIFIVINLLFVLPYFGKLGEIKNRFGEANDKQDKFQKEIAQIPFYEANIKKLEGEGASVLQEDQAVNFLTALNNQAAQSGVTMVNRTPQPSRTNQFFMELSQALTTQSGEAQLVDFLYNLGAGSSLIRARALSIRPDQPRTGLSATMTLVASFQKKPASRSTPAAKSPTPAAKSPAATTPAAKPATSTQPVVKTNRATGVPPVTKPLMPPQK